MNDGMAGKITESIIGAASEVHRVLGPGLLESTYEGCLALEFRERGHKVEQQKLLPIVYKGTQIDTGYRLDLVIDGEVIAGSRRLSASSPYIKRSCFRT